MKTLTRISFCGAVLAALLLPAAAQNSTTTSTGSPSATTSTPTPVPPIQQKGPESGQQIQNRRENQQKRISQGIASGQLNAGEASNLENKESQINHEETDMRKLDNGHLTKADRATLQQQQNQVSHQIYNDRHNGQGGGTPHPVTQVGRRRENLQDRIASGVGKGELNAGQTSRLENEQRNINHEITNDRAANGGHLTAQEKRQINGQQNKVSKQIKHDERHAKPMNHHNK